jgi:hypothetical protein
MSCRGSRGLNAVTSWTTLAPEGEDVVTLDTPVGGGYGHAVSLTHAAV